MPLDSIRESSSTAGSTALIEPLQEFAAAAIDAVANGHAHDFDEALCPCCMCSLFEFRSDGSVLVLARQMKCESKGRHIIHAKCAYKWFIDKGAITCPICREDFRSHLCVYIEAALEHNVGSGGDVQWSSSPDRRFAALNALVKLPEETKIGGQSISSAVIRSVLDAPTPEIFDAAMLIVQKYGGALISQRPISSPVHSACVALVAALVQDDGSCQGCIDNRRGLVAYTITQLTKNDSSHAARSVLIENGACHALVHAFSLASSSLITRIDIALALGFIAQCELGRLASNVELQALWISATSDTQRRNLAILMHILLTISVSLHEHDSTHDAYQEAHATLHEIFSSSHAVHAMHSDFQDFLV